jgi:hypothetical protein
MIMQHVMDRTPETRQITQFADQVVSDNPNRRVNCANMLTVEKGHQHVSRSRPRSMS